MEDINLNQRNLYMLVIKFHISVSIYLKEYPSLLQLCPLLITKTKRLSYYSV